MATLGPATDPPGVVKSILEAGADVLRINLSHGSAEEHRRRVQAALAAGEELGREVLILWDTRGPEVRVGVFQGGGVHLEPGQVFVLRADDAPGDRAGVSVNHPQVILDLKPEDPVLLDDGNVILRVEDVRPDGARCRVVVGGVLTDRKKVTLPNGAPALPSLSPEDRADLMALRDLGMDAVAVSFIRTANDVLAVRRFLEELQCDAMLIAKIETRQAVTNLEEILRVSDGFMVARGDLGVELAVEDVPLLQKRMIALCNRHGKPVITATQMLESMVERPRPTRAEASDVANAILDGTDAVMLSAETASGNFPVEAVKTMARIAERTEPSLPYARILVESKPSCATVTDAISHATCQTAEDLGAQAILTATQSGHTARTVAKYRPRAPIVAITPEDRTMRQLHLVWGVRPVKVQEIAAIDDMAHQAIDAAMAQGVIAEGDLVVLTAGVPVGVPGTTNLIQVHTVGRVLLRGVGMGCGSATGPVRRVRRSEDVARVLPGEILVVRTSDREYMPAVERSAGIIAEEGGLTSHAAVVGVSLGIPTIVGVEGALSLLIDGDTVTMDAQRGLIYRAQVKVGP